MDAEPTIHTNTVDLRQGYMEMFRPGRSSVGVRVGRQALAYGNERMVGALEWTNTSRAFDAVKGWWSNDVWRIEAFAASVVQIEQDRFDRRRSGETFLGTVASASGLIRGGVVEPYLFVKNSDALSGEFGSSGPGTIYTMGARAVGILPRRLDYSVEMAWQTGHRADDDIKAWAGHYALGWMVTDSASKPRVAIEYNHASGDDDPSDGHTGTFDQLYPTNHFKYGTADLLGWRNMCVGSNHCGPLEAVR